ncbi:hypothetical protein K458DRAFT_26182 [Lentithecium fluviatile CBS 122367]|uniref:Uncharacterized protein n=1 Tax=Lentithecium fluviatile CBS 122367 TaxID=1168545 RepID=A0A6G1J2V5_9PLEO|nr:hypothetical protein K458DRAFT_26182 [Lentithecium fluviatile CBS 122367]
MTDGGAGCTPLPPSSSGWRHDRKPPPTSRISTMTLFDRLQALPCLATLKSLVNHLALTKASAAVDGSSTEQPSEVREPKAAGIVLHIFCEAFAREPPCHCAISPSHVVFRPLLTLSFAQRSTGWSVLAEVPSEHDPPAHTPQHPSFRLSKTASPHSIYHTSPPPLPPHAQTPVTQTVRPSMCSFGQLCT